MLSLNMTKVIPGDRTTYPKDGSTAHFLTYKKGFYGDNVVFCYSNHIESQWDLLDVLGCHTGTSMCYNETYPVPELFPEEAKKGFRWLLSTFAVCHTTDGQEFELSLSEETDSPVFWCSSDEWLKSTLTLLGKEYNPQEWVDV